MDVLTDAFRFAAHVHDGQTDKAGEPYMGHIRAVVENARQICETLGLDARATEIVLVSAVLHDCEEDTPAGLERIAVRTAILERFGRDVANTCALLTHRRGESYPAYIDKIAEHRYAPIVKIADLLHNVRLDRLAVVTDADLQRVGKYGRALSTLTQVI